MASATAMTIARESAPASAKPKAQYTKRSAMWANERGTGAWGISPALGVNRFFGITVRSKLLSQQMDGPTGVPEIRPVGKRGWYPRLRTLLFAAPCANTC